MSDFVATAQPADVTRWTRDANTWEEFMENSLVYRPKQSFLGETKNDETLLTQCIMQRNKLAVYALIKANVDVNLVNERGVYPLTVAAHTGTIEILQFLVAAGAQVNSLNHGSGSTALLSAAHHGHLDAVKLLLTHGAKSNISNKKGTTALMRAAQEGHFAICERLLAEKGTNVDQQNLEGMSALLLAAQRGHAEVVMLLVKYGASVDKKTQLGSTCLMLACKRGHFRVVEALVSMGADTELTDRSGRTPRNIARQHNHMRLFVWLNTHREVRKGTDGLTDAIKMMSVGVDPRRAVGGAGAGAGSSTRPTAMDIHAVEGDKDQLKYKSNDTGAGTAAAFKCSGAAKHKSTVRSNIDGVRADGRQYKSSPYDYSENVPTSSSSDENSNEAGSMIDRMSGLRILDVTRHGDYSRRSDDVYLDHSDRRYDFQDRYGRDRVYTSGGGGGRCRSRSRSPMMNRDRDADIERYEGQGEMRRCHGEGTTHSSSSGVDRAFLQQQYEIREYQQGALRQQQSRQPQQFQAPWPERTFNGEGQVLSYP